MKVALFITCLADQFFAEAGVAAVRLLRHLGCTVTFPEGQTCCGQPAYNAGYWAEARQVAEHTLEVLEDAPYVVLPSGSCTTMLRAFYPELYRDQPRRFARAEALSRKTYELSEFIVKVLGVSRLGQGLSGRRIAYHHGCHALRELGIKQEPLTLLRNAGAEIVDWPAAEECCGFGGLFSVKLPEVALSMADRKLATLPQGQMDYLTSADGGCMLHLSGRIENRGLNLPVRPLASVLWEAAQR
ncbi:MAG: (Fe-S)-binding protein [Meiothermus sp.]|uniref:(Fe-S)-binding protein n=1 Tax=Meiothermus sp. TaxID=1955249 RepID=UPI0025DD4D71|nr:(Fe-S)-binding protein [Meiothermus sp.]MCS7069345.1 (Fe-S)-binding protein [Meiothermus sp.]MCX7601540.1 (Fe-S)-binding protein [Meiothermus sp.]MDW8424435.1 (Fe-S)-binding protein [Meiothermus sp.]